MRLALALVLACLLGACSEEPESEETPDWLLESSDDEEGGGSVRHPDEEGAPEGERHAEKRHRTDIDPMFGEEATQIEDTAPDEE